MTANGTTTAMAIAFVGDEAPAEARADVLLRRAERAVSSVSVAPDPVTTEYIQTASDAEVSVFEFIVLRPDRVKQQDLGDLKLGFFENKTAQDEYDLARRMMAEYLPVETIVDSAAHMGTITTVDFG